jgi:hypothetical protein
MMALIPESLSIATETFSPVSAGMVALVAAIVITGFWEFLIQEIKLKRLEQKRRRMTATNQNVKSDRDRGRGIGVGGGRHCATNAESDQSTMRHFDRAVERLQKLDSNRVGDNPITDRVTQDLASDLRGTWSARDLAKGNVQGSKDLPVLLHGRGSKGKLRPQERQRRSVSRM